MGSYDQTLDLTRRHHSPLSISVAGKVVDLPAPKPFQSCPSPVDSSSPARMLLDSNYEYYPLSGQELHYYSPTPSQESPSHHPVFQFPPPAYPYSDPPPSPWKMPALELTGSLSGLDNSSPMVLSSSVSNLNTPRVSISSHGGS